jgi:hypothetical protein
MYKNYKKFNAIDSLSGIVSAHVTKAFEESKGFPDGVYVVFLLNFGLSARVREEIHKRPNPRAPFT